MAKPVTIVIPIAWRLAAPAPEAMTSGMIPIIVENWTKKNLEILWKPSTQAPRAVDDVPVVPPLATENAKDGGSNGMFFSLVFLVGIFIGSNKRHLWHRKSWVEHTE